MLMLHTVLLRNIFLGLASLFYPVISHPVFFFPVKISKVLEGHKTIESLSSIASYVSYSLYKMR